MKTPQSKLVFCNYYVAWDSHKTLMLFDNFKPKANEVLVPRAKKIKFSKEAPMEYFA